MVPSERDGPARRNWADKSTGRCLAPGGGGCRHAIWSLSSPNDVVKAPDDSRCRCGLHGGFYTTVDVGLDAMLCWEPNYECNLYWGNTWPLEVVARWFWKSNRVCEIVALTDGF